MKRTILLVLTISLLILFAGCSEKQTDEPDVSPDPVQAESQLTDTPEQPVSAVQVAARMYIGGADGGVYKISGDNVLYIFPDADLFGEDGDDLYVIRNGALFEVSPNERLITTGLDTLRGYNDINFYVCDNRAYFAAPEQDGGYSIVGISLADGEYTEFPLTINSPGDFSVVGDTIYSAAPSQEGSIVLDAFSMSTGVSTTYTFEDIADCGSDHAVYWEGSVFYYFNGAAGQVLTSELLQGQAMWLPFGDVEYSSLIGIHNGSLYQMDGNSISSFNLTTGAYTTYPGFYSENPIDLVFGEDGFGISELASDGTTALYVCQYGVAAAKPVSLPFGGAIWTGTVTEDSPIAADDDYEDDDLDDIISEPPALAS